MCIRDRYRRDHPTFKRAAAVRIHQDPSLNRSIGYVTKLTDQTITIIQNHYLKNIREELLEENSTPIDSSDNEIAYIIASINGMPTKFMIDTGANVSLTDITKYNKIQKEGKISLPTLPVSNIILIGATGRQNTEDNHPIRPEDRAEGNTQHLNEQRQ